MTDLILPNFKCLRCTHEWFPRSNKLPVLCPKCKSAKWNKKKECVQKQ